MILRPSNSRRGIILPITALLLIILLGMVAFAVDTGWIAATKSDLQNAADAAALAGVNSLMDGYILYNLPNQTDTRKSTILADAQTSARAKAKEYAQKNAAGDVKSLTLRDSDIEFGFLDASNTYTPAPTYTGYPNTIKVSLRRDSEANGSLPLFFGPILGVSTADLTATASATMVSGTINSFYTTGINTGMLPITYDVNHWNDFLRTAQDPDGNKTTDAAGNPELQIYPSIKFKGNFGQLSLNDSHVGASTERSWVTNGVPKSDIQTLIDHKLLPLSEHDSKTWDWQGDTGFKGILFMDINDQKGKTYLLPLYTPVDASVATYSAATGQGANYYFNIVQFVGIKIMPSPSYNGQVIVQPAAVIEPNAAFIQSTLTPVGTTSQIVTTFATPKLSR